MTELKDILRYVRDACKDTLINPTHDMQLDCATRIYNSQSFKQKIETSNADDIVNTPKKSEKAEMPKASEKQIAYLVQLGFEGNVDNLTMQDAKHLITEFKEKKRKMRNE